MGFARAGVWLVAALTLGSGAVGCGKTRSGATYVMSRDVPGAEARALREGKPLLFFFDTTYETVSVKFAVDTFPHPPVRRMLDEDFVAVAVDSTDDADPQVHARLTRYDVKALPTILVVSSDGKTELGRVDDFHYGPAMEKFLVSTLENHRHRSRAAAR